jgi:hypothetical protein
MRHIDRTMAAGVLNEFQGAFDTYAQPDQELQINYRNAVGSGGMVAIYLVRDEGRWFDDYPCASEQALTQYRHDSRQGKNAPRVVRPLPRESSRTAALADRVASRTQDQRGGKSPQGSEWAGLRDFNIGD